ncbi:MAG: IS3 family transposase [Pseudoruminococcus massiliensis]
MKISFSYSKPSVSTEYINFYNNYRIQTKTKLTSLEKRNQFVS